MPKPVISLTRDIHFEESIDMIKLQGKTDNDRINNVLEFLDNNPNFMYVKDDIDYMMELDPNPLSSFVFLFKQKKTDIICCIITATIHHPTMFINMIEVRKTKRKQSIAKNCLAMLVHSEHITNIKGQILNDKNAINFWASINVLPRSTNLSYNARHFDTDITTTIKGEPSHD